MNNAYPCSPRVSCRDIFCPLPAASRTFPRQYPQRKVPPQIPADSLPVRKANLALLQQLPLLNVDLMIA